jgi:hypothetical protein
MSEYDTQTAIEDLRLEMNVHFKAMSDKMDDHAESHQELENRLTTVENHQATLNKAVGGTYLALIGAVFAKWFR